MPLRAKRGAGIILRTLFIVFAFIFIAVIGFISVPKIHTAYANYTHGNGDHIAINNATPVVEPIITFPDSSTYNESGTQYRFWEMKALSAGFWTDFASSLPINAAFQFADGDSTLSPSAVDVTKTITSITLSGKTWKGDTVSSLVYNPSVTTVITPGTYHIDAMTFRADLAAMTYAVTEYDSTANPTSVTFYYEISGKSTNVTVAADPTDVNSIMHPNFRLLVYAEVTLDSVSFSNTLYDNSMNLSAVQRSYTGFDVKNLVTLHTNNNVAGVFAYSTEKTNVNVSSQDTCYFRDLDTTLLGLPAQTTDGSNLVLRNLSLVAPYLKITWHKNLRVGGVPTSQYDEMSGDVIEAGAYKLRIEPLNEYHVTNGGDWGTNKPRAFRVRYNSEEYFQPFTIEKRELKLNVLDPAIFKFVGGKEPIPIWGVGADGRPAIVGYDPHVRASKRFDGTSDASILFSNVGFSASQWEASNGVLHDWLEFTDKNPYNPSFRSDVNIFSFAGSSFPSADIGKYNSLTAVIRVDDGNNPILLNYSVTLGIGSGVNFVPFDNPTPSNPTPNAFIVKHNDLADWCEIEAKSLTITVESDEKIPGQVWDIIGYGANDIPIYGWVDTFVDNPNPSLKDSYTYGDILIANNFDYAKFVNVNGAILLGTVGGAAYFEIPDYQNVGETWGITVLATTPTSGSSMSCTINGVTRTFTRMIYIVPKVGRLKHGDEILAFTDERGTQYYPLTGTLYAYDSANPSADGAVYYFYFEVYVKYSAGGMAIPYGVDNGIFNIRRSANSNYEAYNATPVILSFGTGVLKSFEVKKKELAVDIISITTEKYYDGTFELSNSPAPFSYTVDGILSNDIGKVIATIVPTYARNFTGNGAVKVQNGVSYYNVPIEYLISLLDTSGSLSAAAGSYKLPTAAEFKRNGVKNPPSPDWLEGKIKKITIDVEFVDAQYDKLYGEYIYVMVLVAEKGDGIFNGSQLTENLYYCYQTTTGTNGALRNGGFVLESRLETYDYPQQSLPAIKNYVRLRISGFLAGEGFNWNTQFPVKDFTNSFDGTPNPVNFIPYYLLTWVDPDKGNVAINNLTTSSDHETDFYHLYIDTSYEVPWYMFRVKSGTPTFAYLYIEKLTLDVDSTILFDGGEASKLEYSGLSQINKLFTSYNASEAVVTSGVFSINHREGKPYATWGNNFIGWISIVGFTFSSYNPTYTGHPEHPLVAAFILSGTYKILITVPSTDNYKSGSKEFDITIRPKTVQMYAANPVKEYLGSALSYSNPSQHVAVAENVLGDYYKRVNTDTGLIVASGAAGSQMYLYASSLSGLVIGTDVLTLGQYVLYVGFVMGDVMGSSPTDIYATVNVNLPIEAGGPHSNAVTMSNAFKENYVFVGNNATLYVLPREIRVEIDAKYWNPITNMYEQVMYYEGRDLTPEYRIVDKYGATVTLADFRKHLFDFATGEDITEPNPNGTGDVLIYTVIDVGVYYLKVYPQAKSGQERNYRIDANNYTKLRLEVRKQELTFLDYGDTDRSRASKDYDKLPFNLREFGYYFKGIGDMNVIASEWGHLTLQAVTKDGVAFNGDIIEVGVYVLTVSAVLNDFSNVCFASNSLDTRIITITLTVSPSSDITFSLIMSGGTVGVNSEYDATERTLTYSLIVVDTFYEIGTLDPLPIDIVIAIDGVLYSYNGVKINTQVDANAVPNQMLPISYTVANRNSVRNVGTYNIQVYINYAYANSNKNYTQQLKNYTITIIKAPLSVYIVAQAGETLSRVYGEDNSVLEGRYEFLYSGFKGSDNIYNVGSYSPPSIFPWTYRSGGIDIDFNASTPVNKDGYNVIIHDNTGSAPSNYYYVPMSATFFILPAESYLSVFGHIDEFNIKQLFNVYNGTNQKPEVIRLVKGSDEVILEPIIDDAFSSFENYIKIVFMGLYIGAGHPDNVNTFVSPSEIYRPPNATDTTPCHDTGRYVLAISAGFSANYKAVEEKLYYFEITKAELSLVFTNGTSHNGVFSGEASKIYDGTYNYPTFTVKYEGFLGDDFDPVRHPAYLIPYQIWHIDAVPAPIVPDLDLIHPTYRIIEDGNEIRPKDYRSYAYTVEFSSSTSRNYNITTIYAIDNNGFTVLPTLTIEKRGIEVTGLEYPAVSKIYDAYKRVYVVENGDPATDNTIKAIHYGFTKVTMNGSLIADSGVVAGDKIILYYDKDRTEFSRATVMDENGDPTPIYVYVYDMRIDNENYYLYEGNLSEGYLRLNGRIDVANPSISFMYTPDNAKAGEPPIPVQGGVVNLVYNAFERKIVAEVNGVKLDGGDNLFEQISYSILYRSGHLTSIPSDNGEGVMATAPVGAGLYTAYIVIHDTNYFHPDRRVLITINKAKVIIEFMGDVNQNYGSVSGLLANAKGVTLPENAPAGTDAGYPKPLEIRYYPKTDPSRQTYYAANMLKNAPAGEYIAVAFHYESDNYEAWTLETDFTISRKLVNVTFSLREGGYVYTGLPVAVAENIDMGNIGVNDVKPPLIFVRLVKNSSGQIERIEVDGTPKDVGQYEVRVSEIMLNYLISDTSWYGFSITPASVTVKPSDLAFTLKDGETFTLSLTAIGAANSETVSQVVTVEPKFTFKSSKASEAEAPTAIRPTVAGTYRVYVTLDGEILSDGRVLLGNYYITLQYGLLTLRKGSLSGNVNAVDPDNIQGGVDKPYDVIIEGDFDAETYLMVTEIDNLEFQTVLAKFEAEKFNYPELEAYAISRVFRLTFSDGAVTVGSGGIMTVKLYLPDYQAAALEGLLNADGDGGYKIAHFLKNGGFELLDAYRDGDYLVFQVTELHDFAILFPKAEVKEKSVTWIIILCASITAALIIIAVVLIIIKKKA